MAKTTPRISIIERRLQGPNVFRTSSQPIPLKDPSKWTLRWENSKIAPDHMWRIVNQLGWQYVEPEDLACPIDEIGAAARDGRVVRGERGDEVLMKMLTRDYRKVEKKKTEETIKQTFGRKQLKQSIVSQVASEHGDRAAGYMDKQVESVTVNDTRVPEDAA